VNGVPDDCTVVQTNATAAIIADAIPTGQTGGLTGTGTLINVNNGMDAGYKPDALEAFDANPGTDYSGPGSTSPSLANPFPTASVFFNSGYSPIGSGFFATVYRQDYAGGSVVTAGAQATASVFMHQSVMNEYVLDTVSASLTDWVVTQPIKSAFVTTATAAAPYSNALTSSGACETVNFSYFDREERGAAAGGIDFSPLPAAGAPNSICWESTVISIRNGAGHMPTDANSGVLGSRNTTSISITDTFQNGWARLDFVGPQATGVGLVSAGTSTQSNLGWGALTIGAGTAGPFAMFGLPVTGFMIRTFSNGTLTCTSGACQGNYASLFDHAYANNIIP